MCREYQERQIEREKLEKLIYAANRAPQGGNSPVREYIVIERKQIVEMLRAVSPSFLANSPAAIVIMTDLEKAERTMGTQGARILSLLDSGAAAENIALMAVELGLGVSFVRSSTEKAVKRVLGVPDRYRIDILIGVGYKSSEARRPLRGFEPIVHWNTYTTEDDPQGGSNATN